MGTYGRVLLKLSGEVMQGSQQGGIDPQAVARIAGEVAEVHRQGVEIAIVLGGGNIFRGRSLAVELHMEQAVADQMGMLATVMNCLAFQAALENMDIPTRVQTAIPITAVAEPYIRRRAGTRHLEKGAGRYLWCRHRQPVLHHRYRSGAPWRRDRCRGHHEGNEGRWCLR